MVKYLRVLQCERYYMNQWRILLVSQKMRPNVIANIVKSLKETTICPNIIRY